MKKIKLLEQFLEEQKLEEGLFDVVTKSKAFIKNPISATKITNNGKKLAQAQVDTAANNLDFEKRKLAADKSAKAKIEALQKKGDAQGAKKIKDDFTNNKEVLTAAHDQKEEALKDKVDSIGDRIEDLSKKNSTLQDLASLVKTAARVKKNEVLLKGADDEEKKQLQLQVKQDTERIEGLQKGFNDYEGSGDKEDKEDKAKPEDKKKDFNVNTGTDDEPARPVPPPPVPKPADRPADKPLTTTTSTPKNETPEEALTKARQEVTDIKNQISNNKNSIKSKENRIEELKAGKYDKKKISDPQAEIARLEKDIQTAKETTAQAQSELEDAIKAEDAAEKKSTKQAAESLNTLKSFRDFING